MIIKDIKIKYNDNYIDATLSFSTEEPWEISIAVPELFDFSACSHDLFEAFKILREKAENVNVKFMCNGARENVYPSPMMRSMGGGSVAYELTLGRQARRSDIVNIFDYTEEVIVSVSAQESFYQKWLSSL
jgi:hypothetical protein